MKFFARLLALTLLTGLHPSFAMDQESSEISYAPAIVELHGILEVESRFGPPNFGEHPESDAKVKITVLVLHSAIDVKGIPGDEINSESKRGVRRIQVFSPDKPHLQKLVGRRVAVKGTLSVAVAPGEFTDVVVNAMAVRLDEQEP